ncbi:hypothetical protein Psfp_01217 [Pelotomaculum sp. FP]|nr:hypothetical protein Psfp_01217 [Pelotomaculum sp. FP]
MCLHAILEELPAKTETAPLTLAQWNNATVKSQHTTSYTYDATYKFLKTKSYYQKPGVLLTETSNYDSLGRVTSAINAKSETTDYTSTGTPATPAI